MTDVWGNPNGTQLNQDLVTNPANKNIILVNDVNNGNDAKKALEVVNNSTNASARGLKVQGKTDPPTFPT